MKTFGEIIKEIDNENIDFKDSENKLKEYLKKEFKECLDIAKEAEDYLNERTKSFIEGESDHISLYSLIASKHENQMANDIRDLYLDLFNENIED